MFKIINHKSSEIERLYEIINYSGHKINVSISAIIGMNGSGKSTLFEIIYSICFAISKNKGLLESKNDFSYKKLELDIWYTKDDQYFEISIHKNRVAIKKIGVNKTRQSFFFKDFFYNIVVNYSLYGLNSNNMPWIKSLFEKVDAYQIPIVLNPYRQAGIININSEEHLAQSRLLLNIAQSSNNSKLFIDKKIESIIFDIDLRPSTFIEQIDLDNNKYLETFEAFISTFNVISKFINSYVIPKSEYDKLRLIFEDDKYKNGLIPFGKKGLHDNNSVNDVDYLYVKYQFIKYVIRKLLKICIQYKGSDFLLKSESTGMLDRNAVLEFESLNKLLIEIKKDRSHITLKLRQSLNMVKFDFYKGSKIELTTDIEQKYQVYRIFMKCSYYTSKLKLIGKDNANVIYNVEFVPAVLAKPRIKFENEGSYQNLSSGELQSLSIQNVIYYHLSNIDSVFNGPQKSNFIKYRDVNIILDEVELYFHAEFQRTFISDLLKGIKQLKLKNINSINMIFSTHSPFILSDIPSNSLLKLQQGTPSQFNVTEQTFGANIHDLLAHDFYLEKGFMGEYAKFEINSVIDCLRCKKYQNEIEKLQSKIENYQTKLETSKNSQVEIKILDLETRIVKLTKKNDEIGMIDLKYTREYCKGLIDLIGEPMLKISLINLYSEAYPDDRNNFIEEQIKKLQALKV